MFTYFCEFGTYGKNCSNICGFCSGSKGCHFINGTCYDECKSGYWGPLCHKGMSPFCFEI